MHRLREYVARRLGRRRVDGYDDGRVGTTPTPAELIVDLGLAIDSRPVRERAGWQPPGRVLVMGASEARLVWFRDEVPGVDVVGASNAGQGDRAIADVDALIGWFTPTMIERGTRLRWIQLQRAGAEGLAAHPQVTARDILVTNLSGLAAPIVADHVFALLLSLTRGLPGLHRHQRRRRWAQAEVDAAALGTLHGRTLLVAGLGGIGTAVARRAVAFGMRVLAVRAGSRPVPDLIHEAGTPDDLAAFASRADVVVNALPLTDATRGVFDRALFARLRRGTVFVNVGRGASVVTDDLVQALSEGRIGGAALDVTDPQPLPSSHPLWRLPNVLVTPHVASWSRSTAGWGWTIARENLRRYVAGEPMVSVVDLSRGY